MYCKVTSRSLRMPFGAGQRDVLGMVLPQAGRWAKVVLAVGLARATGANGCSKVLSSRCARMTHFSSSQRGSLCDRGIRLW
jgi:hypothetical protein